MGYFSSFCVINTIAKPNQMRFSILFISCLLILAGCTNSHPVKQEVSKPKALHIALLPLSKADTNTINFLQQELHSYFKCQVDILPPQPIPPVYLNKEKGERYSADSLLHFISRYKTDSITNVLGITGKDIFTTMREQDGTVKQPAHKYVVWGIFGYGAQPGVSCVLSTYRLRHADTAIYLHRIKSVAIHELGHNMGLPHCNTLHCIMEAGKEKVSTIDEGAADFCNDCKKKLE